MSIPFGYPAAAKRALAPSISCGQDMSERYWSLGSTGASQATTPCPPRTNFNQFFAVGRHADRFANTKVAEGFHIRTEHKPAPVAGRDDLHVEPVGAGQHDLLLCGDAALHINLTAQQSLKPSLAIGDPDHFHAGNARARLPNSGDWPPEQLYLPRRRFPL